MYYLVIKSLMVGSLNLSPSLLQIKFLSLVLALEVDSGVDGAIACGVQGSQLLWEVRGCVSSWLEVHEGVRVRGLGTETSGDSQF